MFCEKAKRQHLSSFQVAPTSTTLFSSRTLLIPNLASFKSLSLPPSLLRKPFPCYFEYSLIAIELKVGQLKSLQRSAIHNQMSTILAVQIPSPCLILCWICIASRNLGRASERGLKIIKRFWRAASNKVMTNMIVLRSQYLNPLLELISIFRSLILSLSLFEFSAPLFSRRYYSGKNVFLSRFALPLNPNETRDVIWWLTSNEAAMRMVDSKLIE